MNATETVNNIHKYFLIPVYSRTHHCAEVVRRSEIRRHHIILTPELLTRAWAKGVIAHNELSVAWSRYHESKPIPAAVQGVIVREDDEESTHHLTTDYDEIWTVKGCRLEPEDDESLREEIRTHNADKIRQELRANIDTMTGDRFPEMVAAFDDRDPEADMVTYSQMWDEAFGKDRKTLEKAEMWMAACQAAWEKRGISAEGWTPESEYEDEE
jgi:hypothetical protein